MAKTQSSDTTAEVEQWLFDRYRRLDADGRMAIVGGLGTLLEEVAVADIRARHPGATPRENRMRLAARFLDRETMLAAFGWEPEVRGR